MKVRGNACLAKRAKAIPGYVVSCCKLRTWPDARNTASLSAQFRRIAARRGKKRAGMAVAHSILVIIYHLLHDGVPYEEKGDTFFEEQDRHFIEARLVRQLERLGHQVTLQPLAQAG